MNRIGKNRTEKLVEKGALLVDMRSPVDFRDGHIKGAVNLPLKNFVNKIMGIADKKKAIVVYGTTITDTDLSQGINYAEQLGFTNIFASDFTTLSQEPNTPNRSR